jgi:hypothetical protein
MFDNLIVTVHVKHYEKLIRQEKLEIYSLVLYTKKLEKLKSRSKKGKVITNRGNNADL